MPTFSKAKIEAIKEHREKKNLPFDEEDFVAKAKTKTDENKAKKGDNLVARDPADLCKGHTKTRDENGNRLPCKLKKGKDSDFCHHHRPKPETESKTESKTEEKVASTSGQCKAKTTKGQQCSFKAKTNDLCTRHHNLGAKAVF